MISLGELASKQLHTLSEAYGVPDGDGPRLLALLGESWWHRRRDEPPRWSGFGADCSPYELSVVFGAEAPELRIASEPQADPASPSSYWAASVALLDRLSALPGVDLTRFEAVRSLFEPSSPSCHLAAYVAAVLRAGRSPEFKLYLGAFARGFERADALLDEAAARLGHGEAWAALRSSVGPRDDVALLSLDLARGPSARVKLYQRLRPANRARLEQALAFGAQHEQDDASRFWRALTGEDEAPWPRPIYVCHQLVDPGERRPHRIALQAPLWPDRGDDLQVRARVVALFTAFGLDPAPFLRTHAAMAEVTAKGDGLISWVSLQRQGVRPRITVYFNPKAFAERWGWLGLAPPDPCWPSPVSAESAADRS